VAIGCTLTVVPLFTADTSILIDLRKSRIADQLSAMSGFDAEKTMLYRTCGSSEYYCSRYSSRCQED